MLIEIAGRLVGQEELRRVGECPRNRYALLLSTRELAGTMARPPLQPDLTQKLDRPRGRLAARTSGDHLRQGDVLLGRATGTQVVGLMEEADHRQPEGRQLTVL